MKTYPKSEWKIGARVQLHPATDRWMMGDRFGKIVGITLDVVRIELDRSGETLLFNKDDVLHSENDESE